jgi:multiple sugar transport system substrate-binding protein
MGPANNVMSQLPTRKSLFESLDAFKDPFFKIVNESLVHGQARPGVPIYPEISNQIQIMMGDVLAGSKSPDEAVAAAYNAALDAYKRL